jgi:hypothetical protein
VQPLISDVRNLKSALNSFEKQLNKLITDEGRVRVSHFSRSVQYAPGISRRTAYVMSYPHMRTVSAYNEIVTHCGEVAGQFHAMLKYNYNFTEYQKQHAAFLGLQDALGINYNPAIIWNALKFTFIIDWFINVSRWLDQFKVSHMTPKINILGGLWSYSCKRVTFWEKSHDIPSGLNGTKVLSCPAINETTYCRKLFSPGLASLKTSGLSSSEFTLGAALVIATRRRKARNKT